MHIESTNVKIVGCWRDGWVGGHFLFIRYCHHLPDPPTKPDFIHYFCFVWLLNKHKTSEQINRHRLKSGILDMPDFGDVIRIVPTRCSEMDWDFLSYWLSYVTFWLFYSVLSREKASTKLAATLASFFFFFSLTECRWIRKRLERKKWLYTLM